MPAPATPPTNCRRDIVIGPSPGATNEYRLILFFVDCVTYPTEVINDQAITAAADKRWVCFIWADDASASRRF
jgi:hypothetical protein